MWQRPEQREVVEIEIVAGVDAETEIVRQRRRVRVPLKAPSSGFRLSANARANGSVYNSMRSAPSDAAQRIGSGSGSTNRLTRMPCFCDPADDVTHVVDGCIGRPAGLAGHLSRLDRHERALVGRTSRTIASRSGRGSPSMLNSIRLPSAASSREIALTSAMVMCRASARGCTVIPGTPAATHTRTASITLGSVPPRELRSVATLLTLTLSLACANQRSSEMLLDGAGDLCSPVLDFLLVPSLEHDPHERLGPGISHQQAAVAA